MKIVPLWHDFNTSFLSLLAYTTASEALQFMCYINLQMMMTLSNCSSTDVQL